MVDVAEYGTKALLVHDARADNPDIAFALSRLADPTTLDSTAIGVFRDVVRPSYDDLMHEQLLAARPADFEPRSALQALLRGNDTWAV
jgi:2-oxoglutarate ferredoxin oxidoreductase subunit beta